MQLPLHISFRNTEPSDAIKAKIHERMDKLNKLYNHIMSCEVTVEEPHKHKHKGNLYQVKVILSIPGDRIVATSEAHYNHAHEDAYVAVRDAFDAIQRQLEQKARKQHGQIKHHEALPQGRISLLAPDEDYGRIVTVDGQDIYFHRHSVHGDFDTLNVGTKVEFVLSDGDQGPQASMVTPLE
jgi:ribosomal subunit interface protein